jgi:hypothetical protein
MELEMKTALSGRVRGADGYILYVALLPFFLVTEGIRLALAGLKRDAAPLMLRAWVDEARSQASIATSYALLAKSMLQ